MKTILLLIDGLRVDSLQQANTPALDSLLAKSAYTLSARTIEPCITLPVHFSIFSSAEASVHNVFGNNDGLNANPDLYSVVELASEHRKKCAMFYNWEFLRQIVPPGHLHHSVFMQNSLTKHGDIAIAESAAAYIAEEKPDFSFVYLGALDEFGHMYNYGSQEYLQSLERADVGVRKVLDALEQSGQADETTIIFHTDHGGEGDDHAEPLPSVMTIPWAICGPGVKPGATLGPVSVLDTAPTIASTLNLPIPAQWQGRVVSEAFY